MRSRYLAVTLLLVTHGPSWRAIFLSSKSSRGINYINSFCVLCNIVLYCTAIYRESMVFHEDQINTIPDSKVYGANMGPTWVLSAPDGPHVGPMNLAIRDGYSSPGCQRCQVIRNRDVDCVNTCALVFHEEGFQPTPNQCQETIDIEIYLSYRLYW